MRTMRSLRRLIALATLVGWALLPVALTAYACPIEAGLAGAAASAGGADSVDSTEPSAPCAEHCATRHAVGSPALTAAMPALPLQPSLRVTPATVAAETYHSTRQHAERRTARGDPVPLLLQLQVFRE